MLFFLLGEEPLHSGGQFHGARETVLRAARAQREAFDRILGNRMLYCTACENNGNSTVHNTSKLLAVDSKIRSLKIDKNRFKYRNPSAKRT
jgi:formate dehydrogenase major subunit